MNRKRSIYLVLLALFAAALLGCNAFESQADKNSRDAKLEAARIAMDQGNYAVAVPELQALSETYPGDAEISRALASALAGRAGLDLLGLAAQAAAAGDNASLSTINQLMKTLPSPVDNANIADAKAAVDAWTVIASTPNDYYSLSLAQVTLGLLTLTKDINPAGTGVNAALIPSISDNDAVTLYASVRDALVNLGPGKAGIASDSSVLKSLTKIKTGIDTTTGGATPTGIRNYLSAQSWI